MSSRDHVSQILKRLAEGHSDGLRSETRRRLVRAGLEGVTIVSRREPAWKLAAGLAAGVAAMAILVVTGVQVGHRNPATVAVSTEQGAQGTVRALRVGLEGDKVVLTWENGDREHRVVRVTDRAQLARVADLPGTLVRGATRWVDNTSTPGEEGIVYYVVE
jgi:hypothetical protein